ncbi:MAG: TatD family hydrolase [Bacteroides sp.]|nr:TatD family hydrolase [Bacteroides sp.]
MIYSLPAATDIDSHTHVLRRNAVVNVDPVSDKDGYLPLKKGYYYSVGIHPWNYARVTPASIRMLRSLAAEPSVVAIGETGLDACAVPSSVRDSYSRAEILKNQTALLRVHFELSERLKKPMILHVVKAFPEIIALKKLWKPTQAWIIHGFRGKPQLARELLRHGFYLSYGKHYNYESLALTAGQRLLHETDEMPTSDLRVE